MLLAWGSAPADAVKELSDAHPARPPFRPNVPMAKHTDEAFKLNGELRDAVAPATGLGLVPGRARRGGATVRVAGREPIQAQRLR
jgi:hypothetical protein